MDTLLENPVYLAWSEARDRGAVETGWGGDDLYRCRECAEWQGSTEQARRHRTLHEAVNAYEPLVKALDRLTEASHIILINEVPSDEAWRDFSEAYDGAMTALATVESSPEREGGE